MFPILLQSNKKQQKHYLHVLYPFIQKKESQTNLTWAMEKSIAMQDFEKSLHVILVKFILAQRWLMRSYTVTRYKKVGYFFIISNANEELHKKGKSITYEFQSLFSVFISSLNQTRRIFQAPPSVIRNMLQVLTESLRVI